MPSGLAALARRAADLFRRRGADADPGRGPFMVGDFHADYSGLSEAELAACDPEADALIARSRVVSVKRA